jgi:hypothetical protein
MLYEGTRSIEYQEYLKRLAERKKRIDERIEDLKREYEIFKR